MSITTRVTRTDITPANRSEVRVNVSNGGSPGGGSQFHCNVFVNYNSRAITYVPSSGTPVPDEVDDANGVIAWYDTRADNTSGGSNFYVQFDCTSASLVSTITASAVEIRGAFGSSTDRVDKDCSGN